MTYKQLLTQAMTELAKEPAFRAVGYNVQHGGKGGGSFADVPESQLVEMPLAENLMTGAAIGMSLGGLMPLVYFERFDFILIALDAIVNHLDKLNELSRGLHRPACIIRVVIGNRTTPLFTGATHTQDFAEPIAQMVSFPVVKLRWHVQIEPEYRAAQDRQRDGISTMLVEDKDLMETCAPLS